jgi:DNA-binding SARP family transcriptional activator
MSNSAFKIRVLGSPTLRRPDGTRIRLPVGKPLGVLTYLALTGGSVSRDHLGDLFWPEGSRGNQRASLRQSLWILRQALGEDPFTGDDPLELMPELVSVDLLEAERFAQEGRALEAADLWTHPPFHDFLLSDTPGWEHWTEDRGRQAELRVAGALQGEGERREADGDMETAARAFEAASRIQPHRAEHTLSLIRVLLAGRELQEAEEQLAQARARFRDDERIPRELDNLEGELRALRRGAYVEQNENLPHLAFVGRVPEFTTLSRLWQGVGPNQGSRAVVLGEAGVGKTRLGEEVSLLVANRGGRIVRVKGREGESGVRWGVVSELIRQISSLPGAAGVSSHTNGILPLLVPSLGRPDNGRPTRLSIHGGQPSGEAAEPPATPPDAAVVDAAGDLISAVCDDGPLLLMVDDLQWVDRISRIILVSLVRRTEGEPVLWIFAARTGIPDPSLERTLRSLCEGARATRLRLSPWTREDVGELLRAMAGFPHPEGFDRAAGVVHRAGAGNPLFTVEILKLLVAQGILVREGEAEPRGEAGPRGEPGTDDGVSWRFDVHGLPDHLPFPGSLEEVLGEQILRLSASGGRILEGLLTTTGMRTDELQQRIGLPTPDMTVGLGELLEQRLVNWVEGDRLDFAHDQVRAAARARLSPPPSPELSLLDRARRSPIASAGVLGGGALLVFLLARGLLPGEIPPPPYGGGTIMVVLPDRVFEIVPDHRSPEAWEVRSSDPVHTLGEELPFPCMGPEGTPLWFNRRSTAEEAPWLVELLPNGQERVVVKNDGDDVIAGLSPDGERFLYTTEDLQAPIFVRDLWMLDLRGDTRLRLLKAERTVANAAWSPDGSRIAAWIYGNPDTLVLLTPSGERLDQAPLPARAAFGGWCGDDKLLMTVQRGEKIAMETWSLPQWTADPVLSGHQPLRAVCSPDGSAILYQSVSRGEIHYLLHDLTRGTDHALPFSHESSASRPAWLPPGPVATPRRLEILSSSPSLPWGESTLLRSRIIHSDGSRSEANGVQWEAGNTSTLSVTPEGRAYANQVGRSWIAATWNRWLSDTLWVDVTGTRGEGPLLVDVFQSLDPERWLLVGWPLPRPSFLGEEPVLELRGDGRYWDGILLKPPLPGARGLTVELELQLLLTGRDRQWFRLCLYDGRLLGEGADPGEAHQDVGTAEQDGEPEVTDVDFLRAAARQHSCLMYPHYEASGAVLDRTRVFLDNLLIRGISLPLPEPIPLESREWVHVALQLRADGELQAFVDRKLVGTSPFPLRNDREIGWRVGIFGAALETESYVRNLVVWGGIRYQVDESDRRPETSMP